jgi:hypothetical protein
MLRIEFISYVGDVHIVTDEIGTLRFLYQKRLYNFLVCFVNGIISNEQNSLNRSIPVNILQVFYHKKQKDSRIYSLSLYWVFISFFYILPKVT